jgi:probable aminopeptidase NPEPL1
MTEIELVGSVAAAVRGAAHVVVVAPARAFARKKLPRLLDARRTKLVLELAREVQPGERGALGSTLAGTPRWLHIAVLPDRLSRYNSASRADSIRHVLAQLRTGRVRGERNRVAILLVLDEPGHLLAAANAVSRAFPRLTLRSEKTPTKVVVAAVDARGKAVAPNEVVTTTIDCARDSAELVDLPPSELDPAALSSRARALLRTRKVELREIVGDALLERGLRGIHAVGRAATAAPRLLLASWPGRGQGPHVALVGKGITFDTGGLHIKARGMMETMKADMGGAAALLGAFRTLVAERHPGRLSLLLCLAENAVDARSYKPDDVLRMHSGRTVEINNTDAEGRLLLADGVSWAARELKADVIIDAATLTGAQLIATGLVHAAVVSDDDELERIAVLAGRATGDLVHPLPFAPELYQHEFRSTIADMRNSVADRANAQSSCAAQFVYSHLQGAPGQRRWCHIDLAGPAFVKDRGTGFGVALVAEMVRRLAPA